VAAFVLPALILPTIGRQRPSGRTNTPRALPIEFPLGLTDEKLIDEHEQTYDRE